MRSNHRSLKDIMRTAAAIIRSKWVYLPLQMVLFINNSCCYQAYDPSYISHAHPWASGPSIVLSRNVAGLEFTDPKHKTWSVTPEAQVDLDYAVAGVSSATGQLLVAGWSKTSPWSLEMAIKVPAGTRGQVGVPVIWREYHRYEIRLNGTVVASGQGNPPLPPQKNLQDSQRHVMIEGIGEGNHFILVTFNQ